MADPLVLSLSISVKQAPRGSRSQQKLSGLRDEHERTFLTLFSISIFRARNSAKTPNYSRERGDKGSEKESWAKSEKSKSCWTARDKRLKTSCETHSTVYIHIYRNICIWYSWVLLLCPFTLLDFVDHPFFAIVSSSTERKDTFRIRTS